jgi:alkanesulfonate monooxygenase SsuD/methylene tetrahydromethanopterin reductase-like flavin-dependent oxidoreductase (luciferase family)
VAAQSRFALNVVNAWNKTEIENAGIAFPAYDARYAYGREWLSIVEPLLRGERVRHAGRHFQVHDYVLRPTASSAHVHRSIWEASPSRRDNSWSITRTSGSSTEDHQKS